LAPIAAENAELRRQLAANADRIQALEQSVTDAKDQTASNQEALEARVGELTEQNNLLLQELQSNNSRIESLETRLHDVDTARESMDVKALEEKLGNLAQENESLRQQLSDNAQRLEAMEQRLQEAESRQTAPSQNLGTR
jgi:chromosome segregation ATPase